MTVELSSEELQLLHDLVERRVAELGPEIHHTWSNEFRAELRKMRETLHGLLERLPAMEPA